jgi:hypothetical protein
MTQKKAGDSPAERIAELLRLAEELTPKTGRPTAGARRAAEALRGMQGEIQAAWNQLSATQEQALAAMGAASAE